MRIKYLTNKDSRIHEFNRFISQQFPEFISEKNPELLLVAGGDGAMLRAIQQHKHFGIPFFGKGLGTLNFLMNKFESDAESLTQIASGEREVEIVETRALKVSVKVGAEKESVIAEAVNDVILGNNLMGYHHFLVNTDDESFQNFDIKGTGICISTPLGSTAYNFNNSGTILPLDSNLWSFTGIVCDRYLNDILVEQRMEVELLDTKGRVEIFVDGIGSKVAVGQGTKIILSPGETYKIAFMDKSEFTRKRIDIGHRFRKKE